MKLQNNGNIYQKLKHIKLNKMASRGILPYHIRATLIKIVLDKVKKWILMCCFPDQISEIIWSCFRDSKKCKCSWSNKGPIMLLLRRRKRFLNGFLISHQASLCWELDPRRNQIITISEMMINVKKFEFSAEKVNQGMNRCSKIDEILGRIATMIRWRTKCNRIWIKQRLGWMIVIWTIIRMSNNIKRWRQKKWLLSKRNRSKVSINHLKLIQQGLII